MAKKNKKSAIDDLFPDAKKGRKKTTKKTAKKAAKKAAKPRARLDAGVRGRAPGEARGVPGVNTNQILREVFSVAKGATPEQGTASIMEATNGTRASTGLKYTEDMALGRVKKFLYGYRSRGEIENLGEIAKGPRAGETRYRFTGEVTVQRGRPGTSETKQPVKKTTKKKTAKAKK